MIPIDTSNILFICGGAFDGLEKIIAKKTNEKSVGFGGNLSKASKKSNIYDFLKLVEPDDLRAYGFIPEFIGRLPVLVALEALSEEALIQILLEPRNAPLKQYKKLFSLEKIDLDFTEEAVKTIATKAAKLNTGARALRTILESLMLDIQYELSGNASDISKLTISKEVVEGKVQAICAARKEKKVL